MDNEHQELMQAEAPPRRRGVLLINKRFQLSFIFSTLIISMGILIILYLTNYYFFWDLEQIGTQDLGLATTHPYFEMIHKLENKVRLIFGLSALVLCSFIISIGLIYSHRIAGPIYRMCKVLNTSKDWQHMKEISFREKDFFPELADAFNSLISRSKK